MSDEKIVEVIADYLVSLEMDTRAYAKITAGDILAALRDAGFEVVRLDDHPRAVPVMAIENRSVRWYVDIYGMPFPAPGECRLVPVSRESPMADSGGQG